LGNVKSYFESHAHEHVYNKDPAFYRELIAAILETQKSGQTNKTRILDVGCGDGSFMKTLIDSGIYAEFVGCDISHSMLLNCESKLRGQDVNLCVSDAFNLPVRSQITFDVIHLDSVLHHLISSTKSGSNHLAEKLLANLSSRLSPKNGILVVEEIFYNSFIISDVTSKILFYGLKFFNYLNVDLHKLMNEIYLGLEVNFFSEKQLLRMLSRIGEVTTIRRTENRKTIL
jgi:SAM-dependent methyltransferase